MQCVLMLHVLQSYIHIYIYMYIDTRNTYSYDSIYHVYLCACVVRTMNPSPEAAC